MPRALGSWGVVASYQLGGFVGCALGLAGIVFLGWPALVGVGIAMATGAVLGWGIASPDAAAHDLSNAISGAAIATPRQKVVSTTCRAADRGIRFVRSPAGTAATAVAVLGLVATAGTVGSHPSAPAGGRVPTTQLARASAPWPVDIPLEVNGYQVRFTQAQLEELNGTTLLELFSELYAPPTGNRWLAGLRLAAVTAPDGRSVGLGTAFSGAGLAGDAGSWHQAALGFEVANPATGEVQPGRYHVELDGVTVAVRGPWGLAWDVSGH